MRTNIKSELLIIALLGCISTNFMSGQAKADVTRTTSNGNAINCEFSTVGLGTVGGLCEEAQNLNTGNTSNTGVGNTTGTTTINGSTTSLSGTTVNVGSTNSLNVTSSTGIITIQGGVGSAGGANHALTDVAIKSASYGLENPEFGSAILVSDLGVQIITPPPVGGESYSNSMVGNSGAGSVTNNFGSLSGASSTGSTTNIIGINNNTGGGIAYNEFGTGSGQTQNTIGNDNEDSTVSMKAGSTTSEMADGIASTFLQGNDRVGDSDYGTAKSSAYSGSALKGATGTFAKVNRYGKITIETGNVDESSASMTLTNGAGNTHGFIVNETQATISGGTYSTSLTMADNGATFANTTTGAPIRVHGVDDGVSQFDAVNVRQLYGAVAASMATVPNFTVERGESGIGFGTAMMGSYPAIGMAYATKGKDGSQINIGVAAAQNVPLAVRAGVGWVW